MEGASFQSLQGLLSSSGQIQTDTESLGFDYAKQRSRAHSGSRKAKSVDLGRTQGSERGAEGWPRPSTVSPGQPGGGGQRTSPKVLLRVRTH